MSVSKFAGSLVAAAVAAGVLFAAPSAKAVSFSLEVGDGHAPHRAGLRFLRLQNDYGRPVRFEVGLTSRDGSLFLSDGGPGCRSLALDPFGPRGSGAVQVFAYGQPGTYPTYDGDLLISAYDPYTGALIDRTSHHVCFADEMRAAGYACAPAGYAAPYAYAPPVEYRQPPYSAWSFGISTGSRYGWDRSYSGRDRDDRYRESDRRWGGPYDRDDRPRQDRDDHARWERDNAAREDHRDRGDVTRRDDHRERDDHARTSVDRNRSSAERDRSDRNDRNRQEREHDGDRR